MNPLELATNWSTASFQCRHPHICYPHGLFWLPDLNQKPSSRVSTVLPLSTQALLRAKHLSSDVSTTVRHWHTSVPELARVLAAREAGGAALGPPAPACLETPSSLRVGKGWILEAQRSFQCPAALTLGATPTPKSSATREWSEEPENITSGNHILKGRNSRFTSNGVKRNVV